MWMYPTRVHATEILYLYTNMYELWPISHQSTSNSFLYLDILYIPLIEWFHTNNFLDLGVYLINPWIYMPIVSDERGPSPLDLVDPQQSKGDNQVASISI